MLSLFFFCFVFSVVKLKKKTVNNLLCLKNQIGGKYLK